MRATLLVEIERRLMWLIVDDDVGASGGNCESIGELGVTTRNEVGVPAGTIPQFQRTLLWTNRQNETTLTKKDNQIRR
jgi:hypothetical protein